MHKNKYLFVQNELKAIREKIKKLRQTPVNNVTKQISILKRINQLLTESNDLIIARQKLLENNTTIIAQKIDQLESQLK